MSRVEIQLRNIVTRVRVWVLRFLPMGMQTDTQHAIATLLRLHPAETENESRTKILQATRLLLSLFDKYIRYNERYHLLGCLVYLHVGLNWFPELTQALLMKWKWCTTSLSSPPPLPLTPLTSDGRLPPDRVFLLLQLSK